MRHCPRKPYVAIILLLAVIGCSNDLSKTQTESPAPSKNRSDTTPDTTNHDTPVETAPPEPLAKNDTEDRADSSAAKTAPDRDDINEFRTWTDASGKFQTEAQLIEIRDGTVHLKKTNGKVVDIPLERLSAEDRRFLAGPDTNDTPGVGKVTEEIRVPPTSQEGRDTNDVTGVGEVPENGAVFEAARTWWVCDVGITEQGPAWFLRMRLGFRDAQLLADIKYGSTEEKNGWEGHEDVGRINYDSSWGADEALDNAGIPNCQVTVMNVLGTLDETIHKTKFRLDGEQSWTRLADYVQVVEGEPGKFAWKRCTRCWALLPIGENKCENCGLQNEE